MPVINAAILVDVLIAVIYGEIKVQKIIMGNNSLTTYSSYPFHTPSLGQWRFDALTLDELDAPGLFSPSGAMCGT